MSNTTINGRYRTAYPWTVEDIKDNTMTDDEKAARVKEWNDYYEAKEKLRYKKYRLEGKHSSTFNSSTGKRENFSRDISYDTIGDQLDKLWHDIDQGKLDKTGSFYTAIKAVKDKYPKE